MGPQRRLEVCLPPLDILVSFIYPCQLIIFHTCPFVSIEVDGRCNTACLGLFMTDDLSFSKCVLTPEASTGKCNVAPTAAPAKGGTANVSELSSLFVCRSTSWCWCLCRSMSPMSHSEQQRDERSHGKYCNSNRYSNSNSNSNRH